MIRLMLTVLMSWVASTANASNYPPDYCHQIVRVLHQGPVLFATVASGCDGGGLVIGYKNSGYLARKGAHQLDAVITSSCQLSDGSRVTKETVVKLGREYHGTGYMSGEIDGYSLLPDNCRYGLDAPIAVAFSDGRGDWDSQYGANYRFVSRDFNRYGKAIPTHEQSYNGKPSFKAWDIIVNEMRY